MCVEYFLKQKSYIVITGCNLVLPLKVYISTHTKRSRNGPSFYLGEKRNGIFFVPWQCYNIVCRVWSYAASATGSRGITHLFLLCSSSSCSFINTFQKTDLNNFQNLFPHFAFSARSSAIKQHSNLVGGERYWPRNRMSFGVLNYCRFIFKADITHFLNKQ